MFTARLLCVGRCKHKFVREGEEEYCKRCTNWLKIEIEELNTERLGKISSANLKDREGEMILERLSSRDHVILLDERGKQFTSVEFANLLQKISNSGNSGATFIIGGADGVSPAVYERANRQISLSPLTFPYQLARLVLAEQLYRASTIITGKGYHRA